MLEGIKESTGRATFGFLTRYYVDGEIMHDVIWSTKTNADVMKISNELSMFVYDTFAGNGGGVMICTDYQRDAYTFQCHPCYQSHLRGEILGNEVCISFFLINLY